MMPQEQDVYLYSVSTGEYSDYNEIVLQHSKRFTAEEFQEFCIEAAKSTGETGIHDTYYDHEKIAEHLCANHGFVRPSILNCHLWDYSMPNEEGFVIEGLKKRILLRDLGNE